MSRRNGPKLELRLNLSPARGRRESTPSTSPSRSMSVSPTSSCVSSEVNQEDEESPETTSSMILVGCSRCLMYVMLSELDPRCPKCKSTVLLDVLHQNNAPSTKKKR